MQIGNLHNLYNLVLPMSVSKDNGTDKTDGDLILLFCIVLEPCQNEALDFTNCKSILPRGIMYLAKNPIKICIWYWTVGCFLSHGSHTPICLIISIFKEMSYRIIMDGKGIPQMFFSHSNSLIWFSEILSIWLTL